jgi:DNA-binding CsgD family transcriptional regulator
MHIATTDLIYEAAFSPSCWPDALQSVAQSSGCASGVLGMWDPSQALVGYRATTLIQPIVQQYFDVAQVAPSPRFAALKRVRHSGFTTIASLMTDDALASDGIQQALLNIGLNAQAASAIPMPSGELACFSFERSAEQGPFDADTLERLDTTRPHLARASMIAARLGLAQAKSTVETLAALGLPAAVLTARGRALATNALLEQLSDVFTSTAFDVLAVADRQAHTLLQSALSNAISASSKHQAVHSIAVAANGTRGAMVLHVLPLRRSAHEIFSGGDWLLVATSIRADAIAPSAPILRALFDLSPAEVRLATAIATGLTLQDAASAANIQISTARTYLDRIFRKTGTHQQSQLVALLKSAHAF